MKRGTCELERWLVGTSYLYHRLIFNGEISLSNTGKTSLMRRKKIAPIRGNGATTA